jgi:hypothetical protein
VNFPESVTWPIGGSLEEDEEREMGRRWRGPFRGDAEALRSEVCSKLEHEGGRLYDMSRFARLMGVVIFTYRISLCSMY